MPLGKDELVRPLGQVLRSKDTAIVFGTTNSSSESLRSIGADRGLARRENHG